MKEIHCKAGRVELSEKEAEKIYCDKKYVVTSYGIYQPHYSQAQKQYYFSKIADVKGMTKRGYFHLLSGSEINHILGYEFLNNL